MQLEQVPITYGFRFGWADSCPNTEVYK